MALDRCPLSLRAPLGQVPQRPLLVLLPGMDGTGDLYGLQLPGLAAHFDLRCLTIPPDDLSSWDALAQAVIRLIRADRNSGPVYLCGESFGACLALEIVARAPRLASHLVLVNPASSFYRLPWLGWVAPVTPWLAPVLYQASTAATLLLLAALHRMAKVQQQALLAAMQSVSQPSAAWRLDLLAQFRFHPRMLPSLPTLVVASAQDRLLPSVDEAQRLAEYLPQTQVHILPHSGHTCLLETGVSLVALLDAARFLPPVLPLPLGR